MIRTIYDYAVGIAASALACTYVCILICYIAYFFGKIATRKRERAYKYSEGWNASAKFFLYASAAGCLIATTIYAVKCHDMLKLSYIDENDVGIVALILFLYLAAAHLISSSSRKSYEIEKELEKFMYERAAKVSNHSK